MTAHAAWASPQIEQAVAAGIGATGPEMLDVSGPTVTELDTYLANAARTS